MWNATENSISPRDILKEHLRILEAAALFPEDSDPTGSDVEKSLNYVAEQCDRQRGVSLYREGLRVGDAQKLREGVTFIKRQFGDR